MCTSLQPLRELAHLRLVVHSNAFGHYAPPGFSPAAAHSREFVDALCGVGAVDPEAATATLVRELPSVRYIFLTTSAYLPTANNGSAAGSRSSKTRARSERRQVARAWRVAERTTSTNTSTQLEDGGPAAVLLVELHGDVAETIIGNEELVLSGLDTVSRRRALALDDLRCLWDCGWMSFRGRRRGFTKAEMDARTRRPWHMLLAMEPQRPGTSSTSRFRRYAAFMLVAGKLRGAASVSPGDSCQGH